jgi:hypothetical protein
MLKSSENEVKYIDLRRQNLKKENDKFNEKWNKILHVNSEVQMYRHFHLKKKTIRK